MKKWFRRLRNKRFSYRSLVEVRIFKDRLLGNLHSFQSQYSHYAFSPVLKSNAYGHGLVEVASILDPEQSVPFLIIDSYYEAVQLRAQNINKPLLIVGYTLPENIVQSRFRRIAFTLTSLAQIREVVAVLETPRLFHIKVDTGMHRQGIALEEIDEACKLLVSNRNCIIEGLCSHLADADTKHSPHTQQQKQLWKDVVKKWKMLFPETKWYHLAATAGTLEMNDTETNLVRLGIGLYGVISEHMGMPNVLPALEMRTQITSVKMLPKGETIGYGATFSASHDMLVATVPVGYYEGVDRRLSNVGSMIVGGVECPIVGRVSMNITSIDVSAVPNVKEGDEVLVICADTTVPNSVTHWAHQADTIPYDILVHVPSGLRRVVV